MFRVIPPEKDRSAEESDSRVNFLLRCVKMVACVVIFVIVLGTGVLAKGTVLFMATQTSKTQTVSFCSSKGIDLSEYTNEAPIIYSATQAMFCCLQFFTNHRRIGYETNIELLALSLSSKIFQYGFKITPKNDTHQDFLMQSKLIRSKRALGRVFTIA
jgi:hypothetical protein